MAHRHRVLPGPGVAADEPAAELGTFWDENPNFVTAIEQLATTNTVNADGSTNYAVLGGSAGPFPEIRRIIVEAYSAVLDGGATPQEALDEAAAKANQALVRLQRLLPRRLTQVRTTMRATGRRVLDPPAVGVLRPCSSALALRLAACGGGDAPATPAA